MENDRSILVRRAFLFGVPLLYLVLGLLHPNPDPGLGDETSLFIGLHIAQLLLIDALRVETWDGYLFYFATSLIWLAAVLAVAIALRKSAAPRPALVLMGLGAAVFAAGPLLWAALVLFHPMPGEGGPYEGIKDEVNRWLVVHVGQLVSTPILFFAVWRLLDGLTSPAATMSRCALVVWT